MRPDELERLLYEEEGPALDFKRDQYPFAKATDDQKAELLKDILGLANSWRRTEGFILIGVDDVRGGRSDPVGINEHLPDHSLQQFVNNLTNKPIQFHYEACQIDGKQIGVIRVDRQRRPILLKYDYGFLKKGQVYVRRGSSTDPDKPAAAEELAAMGMEDAAIARQPTIEVLFAETDREESRGDTIDWIAERRLPPDESDIATIEYASSEHNDRSGASIFLSRPVFAFEDMINSHFYLQLAIYEVARGLAKKVRLAISNPSDVVADNVQIEISLPVNGNVLILDPDDIPEYPQKRVSRILPHGGLNSFRSASIASGTVDIEKNEQRIRVDIYAGLIQPGRKVWTDEFYIVVKDDGQVRITGELFAGNMTGKREFELTINATINESELTLQELESLGSPLDPDRDDE